MAKRVKVGHLDVGTVAPKKYSARAVIITQRICMRVAVKLIRSLSERGRGTLRTDGHQLWTLDEIAEHMDQALKLPVRWRR